MSTTNRGVRHHDFPDRPQSDPHGAQFDQFTRRTTSPHGPQFDEAFNRDVSDVAFEKNLKWLDPAVANLPAGCPSCGHHHSLEEALRSGRANDAGKTFEGLNDVFKAQDSADLRDALLESIQQVYADRPDLPDVFKSESLRTLEKTVTKVSRGPSALDHGLQALRNL